MQAPDLQAATRAALEENFTVALAQNGMTSTVVSSTTLPAISTLVTGSNASLRDLVIGGIFSGRTSDITGRLTLQ